MTKYHITTLTLQAIVFACNYSSSQDILNDYALTATAGELLLLGLQCVGGTGPGVVEESEPPEETVELRK